MAGTNNFLQWNPTKSNQETDAAYLADGQRQGGAQVNAIFASVLANKVFYQLATFVTAFGQMMANKNYNMSDADLPTLIATLANIVTNNDAKALSTTVTYSPTAVFDCSLINPVGGVFYITLTGNVSAPTFINSVVGQQFTVAIAQDGVGGRIFTWPAGMLGSSVNPTPNSYNVQSFIVGTGPSFRPSSPMMQG